MTPEEFKERMMEIANGSEENLKLYCAAELMCEVLEGIGYGKGVEVFLLMTKK